MATTVLNPTLQMRSAEEQTQTDCAGQWRPSETNQDMTLERALRRPDQSAATRAKV